MNVLLSLSSLFSDFLVFTLSLSLSLALCSDLSRLLFMKKWLIHFFNNPKNETWFLHSHTICRDLVVSAHHCSPCISLILAPTKNEWDDCYCNFEFQTSNFQWFLPLLTLTSKRISEVYHFISFNYYYNFCQRF